MSLPWDLRIYGSTSCTELSDVNSGRAVCLRAWSALGPRLPPLSPSLYFVVCLPCTLVLCSLAFVMGGASFYHILWQISTHLLSIYLFAAGFFLSRYEMPDVSRCEGAPTYPSEILKNVSDGCWTTPRYKKAVIILIDALRLDFAKYDEAFAASVTAGAGAEPRSQSGQRFYLNHMPIFRKKLSTQRSQSRLYRFDADPPTVTMQRLKGLLTGGLPTFVDFKDNFGTSAAIEEDNMLYQMKQAKKKVVFMGDDTWTTLFNSTEYFARSYPYPSFEVNDLHTVDDGIIKNLIPEMKSSDGNSWDVIIAHFLGVDHCGHTYGPSHPEMSSKLEEMNKLIENVLNAADEDTLVAVFGDHGMTPHGDHGGATKLEVASALFLYSGGGPLWTGSSLGKLSDKTDIKFSSDRVSQIDLVPTLSLLLGLPIPHGNLGRVIPELFLLPPKGGKGDLLNFRHDYSFCESLVALEPAITATRLNAHQTHKYITSYGSLSGGIAVSVMNELNSLFQASEDHYAAGHFETLWKACKDGNEPTESISLDFIIDTMKLYTIYLEENARTFRVMWTQFDLVAMGLGIATAFFGLVCSALYTAKHFYGHLNEDSLLPTTRRSLAIVLVSCCASIAFVGVNNGLFLAFMISFLMYLWRWVTWWRHLPDEKAPKPAEVGTKNERFVGNFPLGCIYFTVFAYGWTFTSNSFMEAHSTILPFFVATNVTAFGILCMQSKNSAKSVWEPALMIGAVRVLSSYPLRTEDGGSSNLQMNMTNTIAPIVLFLGCLYYKLIYKSSTFKFWELAVTAVTACNSCLIIIYWALVSRGVVERLFLARITLPRTVMLTGALLSAAVSCWHHPDTTSCESKWLWSYPLVPVGMLLLGPRSPMSIVSLYTQVYCALLMLKSVNGGSNTWHVTTSWTVLIWMLTEAAFFYTGHDSNFNGLHVSSAYIGLEGFHFFYSGLALFLNSHFATIAVPALTFSGLETAEVTANQRVHIVFVFGILSFFILLVMLGFVAFARRHLMVWAIFAPKLVFTCVSILVVDVSIFLAVLCGGGTRVPLSEKQK